MNRYLTLVTCGSVRPSFVKNLRQNKIYAVEHFHHRPAVSDGKRLAESVGNASVQFAEVGRQVAGFLCLSWHILVWSVCRFFVYPRFWERLRRDSIFV